MRWYYLAKIIKGNHDGKNGENKTYTIPGINLIGVINW